MSTSEPEVDCTAAPCQPLTAIAQQRRADLGVGLEDENARRVVAERFHSRRTVAIPQRLRGDPDHSGTMAACVMPCATAFLPWWPLAGDVATAVPTTVPQRAR